MMSLSLRDHDLVACVRKVNHQRFEHRTIRCRNYSKCNPESIKSDLEKNFDMSSSYKTDNVNFAWAFLQNVLIDLFNKHAPVIYVYGLQLVLKTK